MYQVKKSKHCHHKKTKPRKKAHIPVYKLRRVAEKLKKLEIVQRKIVQLFKEIIIYKFLNSLICQSISLSIFFHFLGMIVFRW